MGLSVVKVSIAFPKVADADRVQVTISRREGLSQKVPLSPPKTIDLTDEGAVLSAAVTEGLSYVADYRYLNSVHRTEGELKSLLFTVDEDVEIEPRPITPPAEELTLTFDADETGADVGL